MNENAGAGAMMEPASLSATQAEELDRACDRFEAAWKAGERPRIEDYLRSTAEPLQSPMLGELIALELDQCRRLGESPTLAEYYQRFPGHADAVAAGFGRALGRSGTSVGTPRSIDPAHDLMLGLLAFQNHFLDRDDLLAALQAWAADMSAPLGQILVDRGAIDGATRALLEALAQKHREAHDGDAQKSLAALAMSGSTREVLASLSDPDLQATLFQVGSQSNQDRPDGNGTARYLRGTASSGGHRFRILRPHAQGGLGAVFLALDSELNREVALKQILNAHADDPISRQRFLLEAEVTGGLEHPGIVPVYSLGTYDGGRPYYAMRFIKGESFKEAVEHFHADLALNADHGHQSLELRKLLRRFLDVCHALDYAHSRGVLHRDLKPGNIILGKHGETLVVDWGLAKPRGRIEPGVDSDERPLIARSASGSAETLPGSTLGTPAYMSPEQASGDLDHLGPQSDVYSLGATLYHLLTGKPPFEGKVAEVLGAVKRGAFSPPRKLDPAIDPALESICLKAMRLERAERYLSPKALAEDVERWMADEPVAAYPDPLGRRLARWTRKHRPLATGAAAAVVVALVSSLLATASLSEANRLERNARSLAQKNEQEARTSFRMAREAVDDYSLKISEDPRLKEGFRSLRTELLQSAVPFYQRLVLRGGETPELRRELAQTNLKLGKITAEIDDLKTAIPRYEQARAILQRLAREFPVQPEYRADLAQVNAALSHILTRTGRRAEAETAALVAVQLRRDLDAEASHESGRRLELAATLNELGSVYHTFGRAKDAEATFREAAELIRELVGRQPDAPEYQSPLAKTYRYLGVLFRDAGRTDEQEQAYRACLEIARRLTDRHPDNGTYREELANILGNLAILYGKTDRFADAERSYGEALALKRQLAEEHPELTSYQKHLVNTMDDLGTLYQDTGRFEDAERVHREALVLLQRLVDRYPEIVQHAADLAGAQVNLAQTLRRGGKPAASLAWFDRAIATGQSVIRKEPRHARAREFLSIGHENRAKALKELGRPSEAVVDLGRAIEYEDGPYRTTLHALRARTRAEAGDLAEAESEAEQLADQSDSLQPDDLVLLGLAHAVLAEKLGAGLRPALTAAERDQRVERHRVRAMALFVEARKGGVFNNPMKRQAFLLDPQIDSFRDRPYFRNLVRDLEALMDRGFPADPFAPDD
jgi:serine/threonine-protein kinase